MIQYEFEYDNHLFSISKGSKAERKLIALLKSLDYWSNPTTHETESGKLSKEIDQLLLEQHRLNYLNYWNPPHITDPQLALKYLQDLEQSRKLEKQIGELRYKRQHIQNRICQNIIKKVKVISHV